MVVILALTGSTSFGIKKKKNSHILQTFTAKALAPSQSALDTKNNMTECDVLAPATFSTKWF